MSQYYYHVEMLQGKSWVRVSHSEGTKKCYGKGYLAAMNYCRPSPKVRLVRSDGRVMLEGGGNK